MIIRPGLVCCESEGIQIDINILFSRLCVYGAFV